MLAIVAARTNEGGNPAITNNDPNSMFLDSNTNSQSTRENNFSEELKLLRYYCSGKKLTINTPFPILHNTGYILKYKLSMTNDYTKGADINIKIGLIATQTDSTTNNLPICDFGMKGQTADWFKMIIKSKLAVTNKITMIFSCDGVTNVQYNFNTDE